MAALIHGPLVLFIVQAGLIIALARTVGLLGVRLGQPQVIAEIIAGILLGPSLLGWLAPGLSAALFPASSLPLLSTVSQMGLVLFMFLVGLEFDPKLLRGRGGSSVAISQASILAPFALGAALALHLHPRLSSPSVARLPFTLFMGAAMSITAFPVLARILAERRLLRSRVGALTITCAAVNDVTAWCILAFMVSVARASGVWQAVRTTILAFGYIAVMLGVVRPFLARLGARGSNREGLTQNMVAATLLLLFLSSWVTEIIGIHALFGAFMMGTLSPKESGFAAALTEKLEDLVVVLLLPLFFAYSGLRTQLGLLDSPEQWAVCALIIAVACLGKFGGSALAARLTGLSWREAGALGILMNTRGLVELIVLNIGLDIGVITPTLFTMMVLMALVTTFMTTPLLRWVYPPEQLAKELAEAPAEPAAPLPEDAFNVLLCVSYERSGLGMVVLARGLLGEGAGRVYALKLIRPTDRPSFYLGNEQDQQEQGTQVLAPVLRRAGELGLAVRPLSFVSPDPAADICNVAEVKGAALVLLGWHKPLLNQAALGGTVHQVMQEAPADVGVLVDRGLHRVKRVLVPYLGSPHDRAALALAQRLLRRSGAQVTVLHVVSPGRGHGPRLGVRERVTEVFGPGADDGPRAAGGRADGTAPDARFQEPGGGEVIFKVVEHADPPEAALAEAACGYDLVIIGVGAGWGLAQRQFGLQPELMIRRSPTSLLVVRGRGDRQPEAA